MLEPAIEASVKQWLDEPAIAEADKAEVRRLQEAGADAELTDRFYRNLEFGTGGMRGVIGAGRNRMNLYTVGAAAQGLANYIRGRSGGDAGDGVAIAFDCRRMSPEFSVRTAEVLAANGIRAYLFESLRPTPELSFAVRHLKCIAGVVITASHNPPEYNGLKVYWNDGAQVVPPHDEGIIAEVNRVGAFSNIQHIPEQEAREKRLIVEIGREIDEAFLDEVDASCLCLSECHEQGKRIKIVYTPLHGTGHELVPAALRRRGFEHVLVVPEQAEPSGEFPTVKSPNPEEPAALEMGIALARRENADLVIATDPDADRAGIAVRRKDGTFTLLTGNRIGALLTYFICEQMKSTGKLAANSVVLSTIVSSDLAKDIARAYGAEVVETLTGFKWIAAEIGRYEAEGAPAAPSKHFLFGMEESYGYLPNAFVRDKDAVTSCAFIADAAAFAAARGSTLYEMLEELFRRFGYFQEGAKSVTMKGKSGAEQINAIMNALRNDPPRSFGGIPVATAADLETGAVRRLSDGAEVARFDLPPSDVLIFTREDGVKVIARPSGTEPKIKFYILAKSTDKDLAKAEAECTAQINAIDVELSDNIERIAPGSK